MSTFGETFTVRLSWRLVTSLGLESAWWFTAGWLSAVHGWGAIVWCAALRIPIQVVRAIMRHTYKAKEAQL